MQSFYKNTVVTFLHSSKYSIIYLYFLTLLFKIDHTQKIFGWINKILVCLTLEFCYYTKNKMFSWLQTIFCLVGSVEYFLDPF